MNGSREPAIWFPTIRTGTGTEVFTERLVEGLRSRGLRTEITWLPLRAEYAPQTVVRPKPPEWANVVHVNTWLHSRFVPKGLPVVATIHHAMHHPDIKVYKGIIRAAYHRYWIAPNEVRVLRQADKVVAVSRFVAETARKTLLDVPMQVIYNGVDTNKFRPGKRQRKPGEPFRLLYVGSWKKLKGVDLLAPIMRELGSGFELRYTGGPPSERDKTNMPSNMHDIGRLHGEDAVVSTLQEADALLFSSRGEGFGFVAAEAMACGLPVIASHTSSLAEIVDDGATGILCKMNDVAAFATAVRRIASNDEYYLRLSQTARERVTTSFSAKTACDAYINAYRNCLLDDGMDGLSRIR
jgi:glycosyltransferase involved in cell wall biosynthesis